VTGQRGQASVELLAAVPAVIVVGLVVGYASVLAGNAAESGALALAAGRDARDGVRDALPGWSHARARMSVRDGRVRVRLRPPAPLRVVARKLEVKAEAAVEAP
jgi:hypothetical protein